MWLEGGQRHNWLLAGQRRWNKLFAGDVSTNLTSARWKKKCQNRQDSLRLENQKQPIGACERSHAAHEEKRGKNQEKHKHGDIVCKLDDSYWLHFNKGGAVILTLH